MKIQGLYGITPDWEDTDQLCDAVSLAIEGGLKVLQLRRKHTTHAKRLEQAKRLKTLCSLANIPFIINDDWKLALAVGADGVHMGKTDGDIKEARRASPELIIGISCYNELRNVELAIKEHADYIAFGAVFPSTTKPEAVHAPLSLFGDTQDQSNHRGDILRRVAIGGISPENASQVIAAGADAIAVISHLFDAPDIKKRASQFSQLFNSI